MARWIFRAWLLASLGLALYVGIKSGTMAAGNDSYNGFGIAMGAMTFLIGMVAYFMVTALISIVKNLGSE